MENVIHDMVHVYVDMVNVFQYIIQDSMDIINVPYDKVKVNRGNGKCPHDIAK
jgi:hypothetical protein